MIHHPPGYNDHNCYKSDDHNHLVQVNRTRQEDNEAARRLEGLRRRVKLPYHEFDYSPPILLSSDMNKQ